jgi:hypothetical protein
MAARSWASDVRFATTATHHTKEQQGLRTQKYTPHGLGQSLVTGYTGLLPRVGMYMGAVEGMMRPHSGVMDIIVVQHLGARSTLHDQGSNAQPRGLTRGSNALVSTGWEVCACIFLFLHRSECVCVCLRNIDCLCIRMLS